MHAIRATHAFDGIQFLHGGVTVLVDGDRIAGVHTGRADLPSSVEVTEYDGTVLPGLFDCHTHLVADATFGGLERVGTMTDETIDTVIVESLRAQAAAGVTTVRDLGDRGYRTWRSADLLAYPAWLRPDRRSRPREGTATSWAGRWKVTSGQPSRSAPSGASTSSR